MIRKATPNDINQLVDLIEDYIRFYGEEPPAQQQLIEYMVYVCQHEETGCFLLAVDNDHIVGFATIYKLQSTFQAGFALKLNDFYMQPQYEGSAIADDLFLACKHYFEAGNYAHIEWLEAPKNQADIDFFLKHGAMKTDWIVFGYKRNVK